jgi:DNA-binding response OmpR family regulator
MSAQALLVAADELEGSILAMVLHRLGLESRWESKLGRALEAWPTRPAELILLSLSSSTEASEAVRQFRGQAAVPIVAIVDHLDETAHVALLEAGVDLALGRPYSSRLLVHQLGALRRRGGGMPAFSLPTLSAGDLSLDPAGRLVRVKGEKAKRLTQLEFRMLYTLMVHRGQVLPVDLLVEQVWGYTGDGNRELVRSLLARLRAKIEPDRSRPRYVRTIPGTGYTFGEDPPEDAPSV